MLRNIAIFSKKMYQSLTGFTLMELLIVVIIIGILATIAMPIYTKAVERSRMAEAYAMLGLIKQAELGFYSQHDSYVGNFLNLDMDDPNLNPNRYFDYELGQIILLPPRQPFVYAKRRTTYNNPYSFDYNVIMDAINWSITVNGF